MPGFWDPRRATTHPCRCAAPGPGGPLRERRRAYSLTDTLVAVAVVAILLGLLLPAIAASQSAARDASCMGVQRRFAQGLTLYTASHDEWIPGYNTSGRSLWYRPPPRAVAALSRYASAPVQVNDWMSPALAGESLPVDRHQRFYTLLERFGCPEMRSRTPVWASGPDGNAQMAAWMEDHAPAPARGISYLMPTNFQLFGGPPRDPLITQRSSARLSLLARVHTLRPDYHPRATLLGPPSRKVALADGFRYLHGIHTDFDASYSHQNWGSFTERSPCDVDSRAWGRRGGGGTGWNIPISYRHRATSMNAAFWDGHAERLSLRAARHPALWAPSGSTLEPGARYETDIYAHGYDPADPTRSTVE